MKGHPASRGALSSVALIFRIGITGASKGSGAAIAKHLAAEGAVVVVNYASSKEGADRVVDEITSAGGKAIAIQADIFKKLEVEQLFAKPNKHLASSISWLTMLESIKVIHSKTSLKKAFTNISI